MSVEGSVTVGRAERDHALMRGAPGQLVQGGARFKAGGDGGGAAQVHDLLDALAASALGDYNAIETAPGAQRFQNRMDANQDCHLDFMVARRRPGFRS